MFDKQYRFTGTHAEMVNSLTAIFDEDTKTALFKRNLDVYQNAPLIGFLFKRKGKKNSSSDIAPQNIFPEQMINNAEQYTFNLRLIILLDTEYLPDKDTRLDHAFRHFGGEDDLALFDEYVLGGVEVLYEKLIEGVSNPAEIVNRMFDFIDEFNERFNSEITNETILELCKLSK